MYDTGGDRIRSGAAQSNSGGLDSLTIQNFRNIESAFLRFSRGLNLIHGANGSGKTSLLEAIYCLGRVRSFRTHLPNQTIRHGQQAYRLVARISSTTGQSLPLGIERTSTELTIHFNGQGVRRLSDLAGHFPVQVLSNDTPSILSGGPRLRRQTLDWALFHVEPAYRELWQRYSRVLRQRNASLRAGAQANLVHVWDEEMVAAAEVIDKLRRDYLVELSDLLNIEIQELLPNKQVALRYQPGWPVNSTLTAALASSLDKDRTYGSTQCGAHRSDFRILIDNRDAVDFCSRGQQKAFLVAFLLGQARLQQCRGGNPGAFMLDDMPSELDEDAQQRVLEALRGIGAQIFVSQVHARQPGADGWEDFKAFHVEHGAIHEVV